MKTDKNKWFVACVPLQFKHLKNDVETTDGERYVHTGELFKCLIDDVRDLEFKFISFGKPDILFREATKKQIPHE